MPHNTIGRSIALQCALIKSINAELDFRKRTNEINSRASACEMAASKSSDGIDKAILKHFASLDDRELEEKRYELCITAARLLNKQLRVERAR